MHPTSQRASPVRVVNFPTPGTTTVKVANFPPADTASLHWAQAGVAIAFAALVVAGITLWAVFRQIVLAREALDKATVELQLTRESNDLVKKSLAHSEKQVRELQRRAELFAFTSSDLQILSTTDPDTVERFVQIVLVNKGARSARRSLLQVLAPPDTFRKSEVKGWEELGTWKSDGSGARLYELQISDAVFPSSAVTLSSGLLLLCSTKDLDRQLRYRIVYDDGITPPNGEFLALPTHEDADLGGIIARL